eukprot:gene12754-15595_t
MSRPLGSINLNTLSGRPSMGPAARKSSVAPSNSNNNNNMGSRQSMAPTTSTNRPSNVMSSTTTTTNTSRSSMGPARVSTAPNNAGRMSSHHNHHGPSSMMVSGKKPPAKSMSIRPTQMKTDTRNIMDKNFFSQCITKLTKFLTQHNYPSQISKNTLSSPTGKEFYGIFEFLAMHIDPSFKLSNKPDEDFLVFFKQIKYPISISKTYLTSVGAPFTWPHLLAALTWLVDLIEYDEFISNPKEKEKDGISMEDNSELFSTYILKSYEAFLAGDDGNLIDSYLNSKYEEKDRNTIQDIQDSLQRQNNYREETEKINTLLTSGEIDRLKSEINRVLSNIDALKKHQEQLDQYNESTMKKVENHQDELVLREQELKNLKERKEQLEQIISQQQSKSLDAKRLNQERNQLQEDINKVQSEKNRIDRLKTEQIVNINKTISHIEELLQSYNELSRRLSLYDTIESKKQFQIEFNSTSQDGSDISDLKSIKASIKKLSQDFIDKSASLEEELATRKLTIKQLEDQISDKSHEVKRMEQKLQSNDNLCQREKEKQNKELSQLQQRIETLQKSNLVLKEQTKSMIENSHRSLESYQEECEKEALSLERNQDQLKAYIVQQLNTIVKHRSFIGDTISQLHKHMKNVSTETLANTS